MRIQTVVQTMRMPFLILTPVCVFLGASVVVANQKDISLAMLSLALLGALSAHISVNMLNEYFDFKSGLDLTTKRTPFSGGSGALPQNPRALGTVLLYGVTALVITSMIGAFFIWKHGSGIIPVGLMGILLISTYTQWINKHPLICLIAPGLGFGFLMVAGTQYVLEGEYALISLFVAVVPFFLVNNLLLLNQYPDFQADANIGRKHFPIVYGIGRSNLVYALFLFATIVAIVGYVLSNILPVMSLIALLPMLLAFFALYGAVKYGKAIGNYPQYLGANVVTTILTPLLLGLSIITNTS